AVRAFVDGTRSSGASWSVRVKLAGHLTALTTVVGYAGPSRGVVADSLSGADGPPRLDAAAPGSVWRPRRGGPSAARTGFGRRPVRPARSGRSARERRTARRQDGGHAGRAAGPRAGAAASGGAESGPGLAGAGNVACSVGRRSTSLYATAQSGLGALEFAARH